GTNRRPQVLPGTTGDDLMLAPLRDCAAIARICRRSMPNQGQAIPRAILRGSPDPLGAAQYMEATRQPLNQLTPEVPLRGECAATEPCHAGLCSSFYPRSRVPLGDPAIG